MKDKISQLIEERTRLTKRLELLNVQSTGRDRVIERIQAIGQELQRINRPP